MNIDSLIDEKNSANTTREINSSVNGLRSFCSETGQDVLDLYSSPTSELQGFHKEFYGGLRTAEGEIYTKRTMISIRYWLQKHFLKKRKIDIVNDPEFKEANSVFLVMCAKIKKERKGAVQHKEPLTRPDLQKLYMFFNKETAEELQDNVLCGLHFVFL